MSGGKADCSHFWWPCSSASFLFISVCIWEQFTWCSTTIAEGDRIIHNYLLKGNTLSWHIKQVIVVLNILHLSFLLSFQFAVKMGRKINWQQIPLQEDSWPVLYDFRWPSLIIRTLLRKLVSHEDQVSIRAGEVQVTSCFWYFVLDTAKGESTVNLTVTVLI
jgi:hypothetical protein